LSALEALVADHTVQPGHENCFIDRQTSFRVARLKVPAESVEVTCPICDPNHIATVAIRVRRGECLDR
jgi:hypothetical protein